jgi:hypothetical protein
MTLPDIVYVVRFSRHSEELRHSLRSLVNLPHGKVWLAGHKPEWATGVEHIKTSRKPGAHVDAKTNLRAACEHPDVSEEFIYFNDDFFVMQPFDQLPVMHRGPLSGVGGMATAYQRAIKKGLAILRSKGIEEPLMYDLHARGAGRGPYRFHAPRADPVRQPQRRRRGQAPQLQGAPSGQGLALVAVPVDQRPHLSHPARRGVHPG